MWLEYYYNGHIVATNNFIGYHGYFMYRDTGFYYLQTRYYDPAVRRFINADNYELIPYLAGNIGELNMYSYCNNNPVMYTDSTGMSVWNDIGNWFKGAANSVGNWLADHWVEIAIDAAFIVGGAIVTALTCGMGAGFMAAFGAALWASAGQVAISMAVSVAVGGLISVAQGGGFFDNIGNSLASGFMWGGIFAGGAQMLSGGFKFAAQHGFKGFGSTLSPDRLER